MENYLPMTPEQKVKHNLVNKKYRAIEMDPKMSTEEKIPYMLEW